MNLSIFDYTDPLKLMSDHYAQRKLNDPTFTIRAWASEMGLESPALLAMILKKERPLKLRFVGFLSKGLKLDPAEQLYFKILIMMSTAKSQEERETLEVVLRCFSPSPHFKANYTQNSSIFDHWSTMAIFSAARIKDLPGNAQTLSETFLNRVDPQTIEQGIELLESEGIIKKEGDSLTPVFDRVSSQNNVPNDGARKYYRQVLDLAKEAVDLPVEERAFQSFSLAIRKEQLPLARELIFDLRNKLDALEGNDASQVYQANLQLFPISKEQDKLHSLRK